MVKRVCIKKGPHSTDIPKGMLKLLEEFLELVQFDRKDYELNIHLGEQIKGSAHCCPLEVKRIDPKRGSVVVAVKPGDNGTRFNCFFFRPEGYTEKEQSFFNLLKKAEVEFNLRNEKKNKIKKGERGQEKMRANNAGRVASGIPALTEAPLLFTRRIVADVLDEETIKVILLEVQMAEFGRILQSQLKKTIVSLGIKCSETQAVKFLEKERYIEKVASTSRIKVYFSLAEKGQKLLGLQKDIQAGHSDQEQKKAEIPSLNSEQKEPAKTELEVLSAEYVEFQTETKNLAENVRRLEDELAAAQKFLSVMEAKKAEIRGKILVLME